MKHVYATIEQLDLAARQLEQAHPSFARFALLLTDNTVELLLHRECKHEVGSSVAWAGEKPKYDESTISIVLGHHVDEKIKFCRKVGVITQDEFDFIATSHKYRNELYHVGILHDDLIYALAWQYHELACDLFLRLKPTTVAWVPDLQISEVAKLHWPDNRRPFVEPDLFENACASLKAVKPPLEPNFATQVSAYAERTVQRIDEALDFLVDDTPGECNEATVLRGIQFAEFMHSVQGERILGYVGVAELKGPDHWQELFEKAKANWTPKYTTRPTPRWLERATALKNETNPADVIRKYNGLVQELSWFEEVTHDAASDLDEWIQMEIDTARGK